MSSDETEVYPYPKRIKIENNHTNIEKEKQQQLEQRAYCVEECMKPSNKSFYLSQGSLNFDQHVGRLEKENCGTERKTSMNESIDFKPWINEKLQSKLLENTQITKNWNLENEEPTIIRDDSLLNAKEHSSEAGLYNMWNLNKNCKNIYELKQIQEQHGTFIEENKKDNDNELKLNASIPSLHTDFFQVNTSSQKTGTNDMWKEHQLLDVPFLHGINSTFSETENKERNNCLFSSMGNFFKDRNKGKNVSSHISPTVKSFKNIQTFKIPQTNFFRKGNMISFSNVSNTLDSNMLSTNLKEIEQKNFKNQTYVIQSEKIYCSQNISVTEKQKFENDKNIVNVANVCSEFNEITHQSVGKQKTCALGEEEKPSQANFKESNICLSVYMCIDSRTPQRNERSNSANILKRPWGKVSYEDMKCNIQETTSPLIPEILRKRDLNIYYNIHCANYDKNLRKLESKRFSAKPLDIKRYLSKSIVTKFNCCYSTTQNLPVSRDIDNILKWKNIIGWLYLYEKLKSIEQYNITELITNINNNSNKYNKHIYLQDTIAEHQNVNMIKSNLASFSYNINHLHPTEEKCMPKQSKIYNIAFPKEKFKTSHSVLCENKKYRIRGFTNSVNFANEASILMPKYLRPSNKVNFYKKENGNCREFKRNSCSFRTKIPFFSIFDTYEKIPLSTNSEEMDQIPLVREVNSNNEKYIEENSVPSIKNIHNVPVKSNDICILPELSISTVNHNSELLQDSARNEDKYSKELNTCHQHLENEKTYVHFPNAGFNSGNTFHCFLDNGQFATSPFYIGPFTNKDVRIRTEEGHCRNSLSDDTEKLCEEMDKNLQYQTVRNSKVSNNNMCFKIQREETMTFSQFEDVQTDRNFCTINSKPMTMKYNLKGLQEVGEINAGQNYITNQDQDQTVLHGSRSTNLIFSYSKDETEVRVASGDQLTTHLSIMSNGCPEDTTDQHLSSESKNISEFELKSKFDLVLDELCMFHEISKEHEYELSKEETNITREENALELNTEGLAENVKSVSQTEASISFPICDATARQNIIKNNQSSFKGNILSRNGKEEKPQEFCSSSMSGEELLYSLSEGGKNVYVHHKKIHFSFLHSFVYLGNCLSHEIIRVQPLKTCSGPIRIGLSRKAKPKKLHPYLK
uniref:RAD51 interacting motif domain-containing protein n=1 Tax=Pelusios castaneus TaxID=367368 RepID=A0A8C8RN85_9SAUR